MTNASPDDLVSRTNAIMTAWELGDTETYRSHCAEGVRMTIPAYGLDVVGFSAIGWRAPERPLHAAGVTSPRAPQRGHWQTAALKRDKAAAGEGRSGVG